MTLPSTSSRPRGAALLSSLRAVVWTGGIFLWVGACAPGELHLSTEKDEDAASGGASGGTEGDLDVDGSGGLDPTLGGGAAPDDDYEPGWFELPCVARNDCHLICDPEDLGCPTCSSSEDCFLPFPLCDYSLNRCQECLDDHDCVQHFGELFGACSAGRCVQCRRDDDCLLGDCENGWCGACEDDWDCGEGFHCDRHRCVPK